MPHPPNPVLIPEWAVAVAMQACEALAHAPRAVPVQERQTRRPRVADAGNAPSGLPGLLRARATGTARRAMPRCPPPAAAPRATGGWTRARARARRLRRLGEAVAVRPSRRCVGGDRDRPDSRGRSREWRPRPGGRRGTQLSCRLAGFIASGAGKAGRPAVLHVGSGTLAPHHRLGHGRRSIAGCGPARSREQCFLSLPLFAVRSRPSTSPD